MIGISVSRIGKFWLFAAVVYYLTLMVLTHIPQEHMGADLGVFNLDKLLHVSAYAVLTFLLTKACSHAQNMTVQWLYMLPLLLVLAALDEWTQAYVGRTCSLADYIADLIGMGLVLMGQYTFRKVYRVGAL
jgi:hypothetical protein